MKIILVRHGLAQSNIEGRYLGRSDEPLCARGRVQARALLDRGLPNAEGLFVSPLRRCRETAQILFPGREPEIIPQFTELDFGCFEGKTHCELNRDSAYREWLKSAGTSPIPGGETLASLTARCCEGFGIALKLAVGAPSAAIVAHSGTIMALLSSFARPKRAFYDCYVKNCGLVICQWDGEALIIEGGDLE